MNPMHPEARRGHAAAIFTIALWGTTYISTKVLLRTFTPIEILIIRFVIGYLALSVICPRPAKRGTLREELILFTAGLSGITGYYLLEHFSLLYTQASNVGVIIATAPFFTAMAERIVRVREDRPGKNFYFGFIVAMSGICLLSFGGEGAGIHFLGDLLALLASVAWSVYSVCSRSISKRDDLSTLQATRRIFFYGIVLFIPAMFFFDFSPGIRDMIRPVNLANLLYLGFGASAVCFVTWNFAVKAIGAVRTSVYIYLTPVVTVVSSVIILHERITPAALTGIALTLGGLVLSQLKGKNG